MIMITEYETPMKLGKRRYGAAMFEHLFQGVENKTEKAYKALDKLELKINPARNGGENDL